MLRGVILVSAALIAPPVLAQDTRCDGFATTVQISQCLQGILAEEDARLNVAYRGAMAVMKATDAGLSANLKGAEAALRSAQRAWLPFRDAGCAAEGFRYRGGTAEGLAVAQCLIRQTQTRTGELLDLQTEY